MWKYFTLARKLLNRFEVFDITRYRLVIQTMYPSRAKANYDQIELEFISYSKNRVTRELVERHLIHLIQANIEPNYRFVRSSFFTLEQKATFLIKTIPQ